MTYKGIVKGNVIELEEPLPYRNGQIVSVDVQPVSDSPRAGSPEAVLRAMHEPPHLSNEDVDALEEAIRQGRAPVQDKPLFDEG